MNKKEETKEEHKQGENTTVGTTASQQVDTTEENEKNDEADNQYVSVICPYDFHHQRNIGDQFMNPNNPIISTVFACNYNVKCSDRTAIYYATLYGTKYNQGDDRNPHEMICNALQKQLMRRELFLKEYPDPHDDPTRPESIEGFRRMLSAIHAHTSRNVLSATMAHLLLSQKNRFTFSHDFQTIPLPHLITWCDNDDDSLLRFVLRTVKDKDSNERKKVQDKFINDIIY